MQTQTGLIKLNKYVNENCRLCFMLMDLKQVVEDVTSNSTLWTFPGIKMSCDRLTWCKTPSCPKGHGMANGWIFWWD